MSDEGAGSYWGTLPPRLQHLVARLENFGDIVFGFAISQLALQLPVLKVGEDLVRTPGNWVLYFATFALLAFLWLQYHRSMTIGFKPTSLDLALCFTFLAFVGLVPYAMQAYGHFAEVEASPRYGLGAYLVCSLGTSASSLLLNVRGIRRSWTIMDAPELGRAWLSLIRTAGVALGFVVALAVDIAAGAAAANVSFVVIPITIIALRKTAGTPDPRLLRVAGAQTPQ